MEDMVTKEQYDEVCRLLDDALGKLNEAHEIIVRYKKACDTARYIIDEKNKIIESYRMIAEDLKSKI